MCDRLMRGIVRTVVATVLFATVCVTARPLAGQSLIEARRHQRDAAIDEWTVQRRADSLAALRNRGRLADTIQAHGVSFVAGHEMADTARRALIAMDSLLDRVSIGHALAAGASYRLRGDSGDRRPIDSTKITWYLERTDARERGVLLDWWRGPPPSFEVGRKMAWDRRDQAALRLPPAFQAWLGSSLIDSSLTGIWPGVYVALATSPTLVAKRCFLGDLAGCRQALRLEPAKDPLTEWLTASARRQIALTVRGTVKSWAQEPFQSTPRDSVYAEAMRCYDTSDDASCIAFLRAFAPNAVDEPLGSEGGRQALVIAALQMSGAPGFAAALGKPSLSASASVESLSGTSLDAVIERWRARAMAAQPERVVLTAPRVLAALGWIFAFGALALKGTRWR